MEMVPRKGGTDPRLASKGQGDASNLEVVIEEVSSDDVPEEELHIPKEVRRQASEVTEAKMKEIQRCLAPSHSVRKPEPHERIYRPRTNELGVTAEAFSSGLRFPLHDFYDIVLNHYGISFAQMSANSIGSLVGFTVLCIENGIELTMPLFTHFFSLRTSEKEPFAIRSTSKWWQLIRGKPDKVEYWRRRFVL